MSAPPGGQPPSAPSGTQNRLPPVPQIPPGFVRLRPHTIAELANFATIDNHYDSSKPLKHWLRIGARLRENGKMYEEERKDYENAFVQYARAATLILERMPAHPEFQTLLDIDKRRNLALNGQDILAGLGRLKKPLMERYEKWARANPDLINERGQPMIPTSHAPLEQVDSAARREAREQYQALQPPADMTAAEQTEQDRVALQQYQEEQRRRDQQRRREMELQSQSQSRSATPTQEQIRGGSRTGRSQGQSSSSSSTQDQAADAASRETELRRQQEESQRRQQEEMKRREAAIKKRQADYQRRQEEAGIKRRQWEAEQAAAEARQQKHLIESAFGQILPADTFGPSPHGQRTTPAMPLQDDAPSRAMASMGLSQQNQNHGQAGPSMPQPQTASSSTDHRRERDAIAQRQTDADAAANAARQGMPNVQSRPGAPSYPSLQQQSTGSAPSPQQQQPRQPPQAPVAGPQPRIRYPTIMSPHQEKQGFRPSLNSMFLPPPTSSNPSTASYPSMLLKQSGSGSPSGTAGLYNTGLPAPSQPYIASPTSARFPSDTSSNPRISPASPTSLAAETAHDLKTVFVPKSTLQRFLSIASINTARNRETCGLLLGKDRGGYYTVSTLLIPRQSATSDTCTMEDEELVLLFTEERSLITLGWIHTHPTQSCFMSSVDLHTHSGFQKMLPESFAIVCAPKHQPDFGVFRLTDPPGLSTILSCNAREAFHPHADLPIYTDADRGHVVLRDGMSLEIVDLR